MVADGLVVRTAQAITVTGIGRLLLRNIAMCFDQYLASGTQAAPASRTV
jgi:oxygen-independent coproporphyrinogen-3 oxidase